MLFWSQGQQVLELETGLVGNAVGLQEKKFCKSKTRVVCWTTNANFHLLNAQNNSSLSCYRWDRGQALGQHYISCLGRTNHHITPHNGNTSTCILYVRQYALVCIFFLKLEQLHFTTYWWVDVSKNAGWVANSVDLIRHHVRRRLIWVYIVYSGCLFDI